MSGRLASDARLSYRFCKTLNLGNGATLLIVMLMRTISEKGLELI